MVQRIHPFAFSAAILTRQTPAEVLAFADKNAYAPLLRRHFPQRGRGVQTLIIGFEREHAVKVAQVIRGSRYGIAPAAQVGYRNLPEQFFEVPIPPIQTLGQLNTYLIQTMTGALGCVTQALQEIAANRMYGAPVPRLINISIENSRATLCEAMFQDILPFLQEDLRQGRIRDPHLAKLLQMGGNRLSQSVQRFWVDYVDRLFDADPAIHQAVSQYQSAARQLKTLGISIIVPAGNSRMILAPSLSTRPDASTNYFALSPDVITVGASNPNQTPLDTRDDIIAPFSGAGAMMSAPGEAMVIESGDGVVVAQGTSYSAGWLMGLMALLVEAQPHLTPDGLMQILTQSCDYPRGTLSGYGVINPFQALSLVTGLPGPLTFGRWGAK